MFFCLLELTYSVNNSSRKTSTASLAALIIRREKERIAAAAWNGSICLLPLLYPHVPGNATHRQTDKQLWPWLESRIEEGAAKKIEMEENPLSYRLKSVQIKCTLGGNYCTGWHPVIIATFFFPTVILHIYNLRQHIREKKESGWQHMRNEEISLNFPNQPIPKSS